MVKDIKIGIAGLGGSIIMHVQIAKYLKGAHIEAVMDVDPNRVKKVMEQYAIPQGYTDYTEMILKAGLDAVVIVSPVIFHKEQTMIAAEHHVHVLCEKPMAPTPADCDAMIAACRKNDVVLMVGFMKRFDRTMNRVNGLIQDGSLGSIYHLTTLWSWSTLEMEPAGWRMKLDYTGGGGIYQDHGSHVSDIARWWLGEITDVSAEVSSIKASAEVEDHAIATYRHISGATSVHIQSHMTSRNLREQYILDGEKGSCEVYYDDWWSGYSAEPFRLYLWKNGSERIDLTVPRCSNIDDEITENGKYKLQMDYFIDCIREGRKPERNTGEDGMKAMECVVACYISSAMKKKVHLPLTGGMRSPDMRNLMEIIKKGSPVYRIKQGTKGHRS